MRRLPHMTWLRAFEAAARHSSFSSAAEELNLTPAAVSQQIRLLEQHLGVQLFKRLAKGVLLTDRGQAYAQPIRKSFVDMQTATDALFRVQHKSVIRIRASISFAALVLAPRLHRFRALQPDVEIDLSTTVWADRMGDASIDLDIRYGDGDWPERGVYPLNRDEATIVCHTDYAASFGDALTLETMALSDVVQIVGSETDWTHLSDHYSLNLPTPTHWMKADSSLMALQIVMAGHGCVLVSRSLARQFVDSGLLIEPLSYKIPLRKRFFIVERDDLKNRPDITAFVDWLRTEEL